MIKYPSTLTSITPGQLEGFFQGWPNPPSPKTHLRILEGSDEVILAIDKETDEVVGFVTAISDGVLCAYIPLLEVRSTYRGRGIGTELMRRMLDRLSDLYMVDLLCDPDLQPFYASLGMHPASGMMRRNYKRQSGKA